MDPTTAVLLTLFPTSDHREVGVGPYAFDSAQAPLIVDGLPSAVPQGLEIMTRRIYDSEEALYDEDSWAAGQGMNVRFYRDADGNVVLDRFELESLALNVRVRPELGDKVDVGLFMGSWERVWRFGDTGRTQWRVYSPMNVTLLGLSKVTDDPADKLKYYASAGTGVGGEVLGRVAGPVGIQARAEVQANARRRRGGDQPFSTRQEVTANAELGLTFIDDSSAWVVGAWAEHVSQWEPWDAEGRDGIDRTYFAAGARLSGRFYKEREYLPMPDVSDGTITGDRDLDALLESIRQESANQPPEGQSAAGPTVEGEAKEADQEDGERAAHLPLQVNWSEVEVLEMVDPEWPQDAMDGASCSMVFFVDTTGVPYDVRPDECDSDLRPLVMEAAWGWRFAPIVENGDTVSATFKYTITKGQVRKDAE